ncbi:hypothetical protein AVEN_40614-1 [Araneus ventricosus]|uniref:Uncharacterized protein n=1 Tax=Araneus ventricosus TaxID=182803 RepID=A0A4Y2JCB9_ARAVE|nr:hypothetical protein AVEN_40614-1 [Araneus ventricosus]
MPDLNQRQQVQHQLQHQECSDFRITAIHENQVLNASWSSNTPAPGLPGPKPTPAGPAPTPAPGKPGSQPTPAGPAPTPNQECLDFNQHQENRFSTKPAGQATTPAPGLPGPKQHLRSSTDSSPRMPGSRPTPQVQTTPAQNAWTSSQHQENQVLSQRQLVKQRHPHQDSWT